MNPTDADAEHNLQYALSLRKDSLSGVKAQTSFLYDWMMKVPPGPMGIVFSLLFLIMCCGFSLYNWFKKDSIRHLIKRWTVLIGFGVGASATVLMVQYVAGQKTISIVMEDEVGARKGPTESAAISLTINQGLVGTVIESQGTFDRLRLENGFDVWVPRASLAQVGAQWIWKPAGN